MTVTCLMPGATETDFFERADMLTGQHNKLRSAIALVTPSDMLAEQHRLAAEPGSAAR